MMASEMYSCFWFL